MLSAVPEGRLGFISAESRLAFYFVRRWGCPGSHQGVAHAVHFRDRESSESIFLLLFDVDFCDVE